MSILFVLVSHSRMSMPPALADHPLMWSFLANSQLGVRVFFVISGYLITTLLVGEQERRGTIRLGAFYQRRALRIFPAFYTYILVVAALAYVGVVDWPARSDFLAAGTFSWNYAHVWISGNYAGHYLLDHFWTLSLEEQFYLLWPATLLLAGTARARGIAVAIVVLAPIARIATYFLWPASRPSISGMLHTTADSLMFGALLALFRGEARFERAAEAVTARPWLSVLALFVALVASPLLTARFTGTYALSVGWSLECVCIVVVILYVTRAPASVAGRILNSKPVVLVGILSYSLYLWSMLFFTGVNKTWTGQFPVNLLACVVAASLSYVCIERPFLRLKSGTRSSALTPVGAH